MISCTGHDIFAFEEIVYYECDFPTYGYFL